ncbi:MAG: FixH family protein [Vicingaceae bacterium]
MWRIALIFVLFMGFIISMVSYTATLDTDLVAEDYYQQEVNYQATIDAKKNALELKNNLVIQQDAHTLAIQFPEQADFSTAKGIIHFYHPKNVKYDFEKQLDITANNILTINKTNLQKGNYTIKILWEANSKKYHIEKSCYVS